MLFQPLCLLLDATQPDPSSFLPLLSQSINEPIGNDTKFSASHDAGSRHLNRYVRSLLPVPDRSTRRDLLTPLIAPLFRSLVLFTQLLRARPVSQTIPIPLPDQLC